MSPTLCKVILFHFMHHLLLSPHFYQITYILLVEFGDIYKLIENLRKPPTKEFEHSQATQTMQGCRTGQRMHVLKMYVCGDHFEVCHPCCRIGVPFFCSKIGHVSLQGTTFLKTYKPSFRILVCFDCTFVQSNLIRSF